MWKSSMCESPNVVYIMDFKHTNELYYCNLLNGESIQKQIKNLCIDLLVE